MGDENGQGPQHQQPMPVPFTSTIHRCSINDVPGVRVQFFTPVGPIVLFWMTEDFRTWLAYAQQQASGLVIPDGPLPPGLV